jgi:hypothetical protein
METRVVQGARPRTASKRARRVGRAWRSGRAWRVGRPRDPRSLAVERAREEIEAAILLVGGGQYPRVLISNLADDRRCLGSLRGLADATGVALEALPRADGRGIDVAVTAR